MLNQLWKNGTSFFTKETRELAVHSKQKLMTLKSMDSLQNAHKIAKKAIESAKDEANNNIKSIQKEAERDAKSLLENQSGEANADFIKTKIHEISSRFSSLLATPVQEINSVKNITNKPIGFLSEFTQAVQTYCQEFNKNKLICGGIDTSDLKRINDDNGILTLNKEIEDTEKNLAEARQKVQKIKSDYYDFDPSTEEENGKKHSPKSLSSWPIWLFFVVMGLLGLGEFGLLYTMLHSQEAGLEIDKEGITVIIDMVLAGGGSLALLIVLILLSHKVGQTIKQSKLLSDKAIVIIISAAVISIFASVTMIRSDYHEINFVESNVEQIESGIKKNTEAIHDIEDAAEEDGTDLTANTELNTLSDKTDALKKQEMELRKAARDAKKRDSLLFIFISIGYFLAGAVMGYYVHPGNEKYEKLKKDIEKFTKKLKRLHKQQDIIIHKSNTLTSNLKNILTQELDYFEKMIKELQDTTTEYIEIKEYIYDKNKIALSSYFNILHMNGIQLSANYDDIFLKKINTSLKNQFMSEHKVEHINQKFFNEFVDFVTSITTQTFKCHEETIDSFIDRLSETKMTILIEPDTNLLSTSNEPEGIDAVNSHDLDAISGRAMPVTL